MLSYQVVFTIVGIAIASVRYALYFRDIARRTVKPHVFSWFIWGILTGITFFAQMTSGGGLGAWITGYVCFACLVISFVALFRGTKDITRFDWFCFFAAFVAIVIWFFMKTPLYSVIIALFADGLGYIPTYRKSIKNPYEESASGFAIASSRSIFGILALSSFNFITLAAPVFYLIGDAMGAILIYVRRMQVRN